MIESQSQRCRATLRFASSRYLLLPCLGAMLALSSGCAILGAAAGSHIGSTLFNHAAGEMVGRMIGNSVGRAMDQQLAKPRETQPPTIIVPATPASLWRQPPTIAPISVGIAPSRDVTRNDVAMQVPPPVLRPLVYESRPAWPPPVPSDPTPSKS